MKDFILVYWSTQFINSSGNVRYISANTLVWTNLGTTTVKIDNLILTPGQSFSMEGYPGEVIVQGFDVFFEGANPNGNKLQVNQKEIKGTASLDSILKQ